MRVSWKYEDETNNIVMTVVFDDQEQINQLWEALQDRDELGELKAAVSDQCTHKPEEKQQT